MKCLFLLLFTPKPCQHLFTLGKPFFFFLLVEIVDEEERGKKPASLMEVKLNRVKQSLRGLGKREQASLERILSFQA